MKKKFLALLSILILSLSVSAKSDFNSTPIANAIKLYKTGNYTECYVELETIIKNDPTNVLAYYYMGMTSAQLGKKEDAISYYEKVLLLEPNNNNLHRFAKKGKRCLETPDKCENSLYDTLEDEFIQSKKNINSTEEVKSELERLKLENFRREMNRNDSIDANRFRDYKDFSSVPTNDEIVAALRTLQKAGLSDVVSNNYSDVSLLLGNEQNPMLNIMGSSSMNPQLIQALLTNNITQGF